MDKWSNELAVAIEASKAAAELAQRMQPGITAESKADLSPVTLADKECEREIVARLLGAFPDDGLLGEEGANAEAKNGRRWIVDPIDGTRDYLRGNPLWANLIALEVNGKIVVGVANLPCLNSLYWATEGGGAFCNGKPIHASDKTDIADSVLCVNGLNKTAGTTFRGDLLDWADRFWAVRSLGGAADSMLLASGQAEVWIEPTASPWDLAPLDIIYREAGVDAFALDGRDTIYGGSYAACVPGLRAEFERFLGIHRDDASSSK